MLWHNRRPRQTRDREWSLFSSIKKIYTRVPPFTLLTEELGGGRLGREGDEQKQRGE